MNAKVHKVLVAAREILSDPAHWTKGSLARDAKGWPVEDFDEKAVCFCAVGAVSKALEITKERDVSFTALNVHLRAALSGSEFAFLTDFNDADRTTHADVLAVFDRAINATKEAT